MTDVQKPAKKDKKVKKAKQEEEAAAPVAENGVTKEKKEKKAKRAREEPGSTEVTVEVIKTKNDKAVEAPANGNGHAKKEKKEKKAKRAEETSPAEPKAKKQKAANIPDVKAWREEHSVVVCESGEKYDPVGFSDSGLPSDVLKCCAGFTDPTPIQAQSWPMLLDGRDVIGIAKTGSGKTYAFLLPCLASIKKTGHSGSNYAPYGLVLAPTRELCSQIAEVGFKAAEDCGLHVVCVYGGVPKQAQRADIRKGCHVVVATPGRLKDLVQEEALTLASVDYGVLDEADRMLDMGFEDDVREILKQTKKTRQTLMFSATWPASIQALAKEFLKKPARITIGSEGLAANHSITQKIEFIADEDKFRRLQELLKQYHGFEQKNRVIVFALYKKEAARLEQQLWKAGWNCVAIQGDASQAARNEAFRKFSTGEVPLLIATDVAARGLDIKGVEYVINCSFPLTVEDYVHRIGRTGRAGLTGFAHSFFTIHDKSLAPDLIRVMEEANQEVPKEIEKFRNVPPKRAPTARHALETKSGGFKMDDSAPKTNVTTFDSDSE
ncbi:DEAD-box ATP-dependent RNA helicase 5 [Diplonema papillatum]|nr:DEAD-box ATP-dependent RNA helicase 5 [Diplonema papillatum]